MFYFSLICYAIIEDGQKDCVANTAGRLEKGSAFTGFKYALVSYIPTAAFVILQMLLMLLSKPEQLGFLKLIFAVIIRFFFMGTYLGFSIFLTSSPQSTAMSAFICDNYIFHTMLLVLMPLVCGLAYYLAFNGKVHVDTSEKKKKK